MYTLYIYIYIYRTVEGVTQTHFRYRIISCSTKDRLPLPLSLSLYFSLSLSVSLYSVSANNRFLVGNTAQTNRVSCVKFCVFVVQALLVSRASVDVKRGEPQPLYLLSKWNTTEMEISGKCNSLSSFVLAGYYISVCALDASYTAPVHVYITVRSSRKQRRNTTPSPPSTANFIACTTAAINRYI